MLTPNYATPEDVKKVLVECEDFNKDHKTIQEIEKELGVEVNTKTAGHLANLINRSITLEGLKEMLQLGDQGEEDIEEMEEEEAGEME